MNKNKKREMTNEDKMSYGYRFWEIYKATFLSSRILNTTFLHTDEGKLMVSEIEAMYIYIFGNPLQCNCSDKFYKMMVNLKSEVSKYNLV